MTPAGMMMVAAALYFVLAIVMFTQVTRLHKDLVHSSALNYANVFVKSVLTYRDIYSSQVVANVKKGGLEVTHDYHAKEAAIPLPATFTLLFGEKFTELRLGSSMELYSPYPFPWRETGGLGNDFKKAAWESFRTNPDEPFYRFEKIDGHASMRYAVADKLKASCIGCHNGHPLSPKTDWQEGDIRGVMEVVVPLGEASTTIQQQLNYVYLAIIGLGVLFVIGVVLSVRRMHRTATELTDHVDELEITQAAYQAELKERLKSQEEAENANNAKSQFLSSMSHELRTPLNAILGFGQLLEMDAMPAEKRKNSVDHILKAGYHLLDLINDVLDLSKIDAGRMELSMEPVAVAPVIEECLTLMKSLAADRGITFSQNCPADVVAYADRTRLKQVLLNLISNAVKYNNENGTVMVNGSRDKVNDSIVVSVIDNGPGIEKAKQQFLFDPFNRLDAENGEIEGTGIGLTISRRLLKLMGGDIQVESEPGTGSTFTMILPVGLAIAKPEIGNETAESGSIHRNETADKFRILDVEDNPANLEFVSELLSLDDRITLFTASRPEPGIELAFSKLPQLILLDINMPEMDGFQVLDIIRQESSLDNVPVVAITAMATEKDIERGRAAGFTDYMTKPIDVKKFMRLIEKMIRASA